jgi:predicted nucleic acid-binding protein
MSQYLIILPQIYRGTRLMHNSIISDTSCLIILSNIDHVELLKEVYGQILTTPEIAHEFGEILPDWVKIMTVNDKQRQILLEIQLDKGEASAIALSLEIPGSTLILDDYKARKIADRLGLKYTGTIGIIIKAKLNGFLPSIKPLLKAMKQKGFRMSPEIEIQALFEAQEK